MQYKSVICGDVAHFAEDPGEKQKALYCILHHYGAGSRPFLEKELQMACVIQIEIAEMTGKKMG